PGGIKVFGAPIVGVWAPGNFPNRLPAGVGRPLAKGTDLALQVHYHKTGKPETDRTAIGLYFSREPVTRTVQTGIFGPFNIDIPPGAKRHPAAFERMLPVAVRVYNVMPHMHLLGKEIKVWAVLPDGTQKDLVWVKDWDYRWQDTYWYREPLDLPAGTEIHVAGYYDNTPENPLNPSSPPRRVRFGEQTTDEMCFAIMDFTPLRP
ncbi:MAG TPA: hypothetical protein VFU47_16500, partial [Armatimonadota bacterium]|nr:hypothetical protein [Armatimonadota bacterium]